MSRDLELVGQDAPTFVSARRADEEACKAAVALLKLRTCPECNGEGGFYTCGKGEPVPLCDTCNGLGFVERKQRRDLLLVAVAL